jgi:hypothetical protein
MTLDLTDANADGRAQNALFVLLFLGFAVAAVLAMPLDVPVSCQRHAGPFSNDFSVDFDINRVECRKPWMKRAPTTQFWGVPPYVGIAAS